MTDRADRPLISVVMIFRDAERFMAEAVRSVLDQTYSRIELLLVDDGSVDRSGPMARDFAAEAPDKVRVLHHPGQVNRGMSASRNLGIEGARGDLIGFLDADDAWDRDHLARQAALLAGHPAAGLVCGRALNWRSWAGDGQPDDWSPLPFAPETVVPPPHMLTAVLRRGAYSVPMCSLLVRAELLRDVGGAEEQFRGLFEDQVLLAKLHLTAASVIDGGLTARYRQHSWSSTAVAQRDGSYHPSDPNPAYETFIRWLAGRPEVTGPQADGDLAQAVGEVVAGYDRLAHRRRSGRESVVAAARRIVPPPARSRVRRLAGPLRPLLTGLRLHRPVTPLSRQFGYDRGLPVDRWYIERFLAENAENVTGSVLEVGDAAYTRRFGGARVSRSDVLNVRSGDPDTTYVADLADAPGLPSGAFDCAILTQTLHLVYDLPAAVRTVHRVLRPGGVALVTVPGISPISTDTWAGSWYWSLTPLAAQRLFGDVFGATNVEVTGWGNVASAVAFLQGRAAQELQSRELDVVDPQFPLLVTIRALRPAGASGIE